MSLNLFQTIWHWLAAGLTISLAVFAASHAILYKRDVRATLGWVGLILMVPFVGAVLYVLLGINRIRRRAIRLRHQIVETRRDQSTAPAVYETIEKAFPSFASFSRLSDRVTRLELTQGNQITPLVDERTVFQAMTDAIDQAQGTLALSTYIFDRGDVASALIDALARAVEREVTVRVLIDSVGSRYSLPPITRDLRRRGITCSLFGRHWVPWRWPYFNLRNHRKILVVDGQVGFTGGINIRDSYLLDETAKNATRDLHFQIKGPCVQHLSRCFVEDWFHARGEELKDSIWCPAIPNQGSSLARGINDGPDEDFEQLKWMLLGAISTARKRIRIATPYFLPDTNLIFELNLAAMRGVKVQILVPETSNLLLVSWAARHQYWQLLKRGCQIYQTQPPFDHSKIMLVDDCWTLFGSANWDPRSLRLNFEFNVECYDAKLAATLNGWYDKRLDAARAVSLEELDGRPIATRLRDGIARLFMPYL